MIADGLFRRTAQKRLDGGIGTHFEVSQAQAPLPETHRQLDALEEAIALSRNQLAALAGKGPGDGASLQRPSLALGAPLKLPSALPAELLGQRPDVVAARWRVAAQAHGIEVARAGFYPNVDLVGGLGYMATGGGALEFLTGKKLTYNVGPAISLPIFDGGRNQAGLDSANVNRDIAVAQYERAIQGELKSAQAQIEAQIKAGGTNMVTISAGNFTMGGVRGGAGAIGDPLGV